MYGLPDTLRPLSAAEEQVMLAVWACPGAAARRDISQKLKATGWAAATVLNFLYRLEEKGWVRSAKQGNCNVYVPLVTRRAYGVYCMRQRLDTLFDGDLAADTAVYLRQQTGRDLNEVNASLVDAGCKSCQIADHTTAQG